jgi:hypothetical protein
MIRVRFKTDAEDYRPVTWPLLHPYWCTGHGDGYAIIVAYADNSEQILELWPEAFDLDVTQVEGYVFTDRFPKPDWFKPENTDV